MSSTDNSNHITCIEFGSDRHQKHPGFFFCSNCDIWESIINDKVINNKSIPPTRYKKYPCNANHIKSFASNQPDVVVPTHLCGNNLISSKQRQTVSLEEGTNSYSNSSRKKRKTSSVLLPQEPTDPPTNESNRKGHFLSYFTT